MGSRQNYADSPTPTTNKEGNMEKKRLTDQTPEERLKWLEGQIAERERQLAAVEQNYRELGMFGETYANKIRQLEDRIADLTPKWKLSVKNELRFHQILRLFEAIMRSRNI
jgi:uncharacterized coiled-coil protein SlyX